MASENNGQASRLPAAPEPPAGSKLAATYERVRAQGRKILNIMGTSAHSPDVADAIRVYSMALRDDVLMSRKFQEMLILYVAHRETAPYPKSVHTPMALQAGLSQAQVEAIGDIASPLFDAKEQAALAYAERVTTLGGVVDDATFARLSAQFSSREIVEITAVVTFYVCLCRYNTALGVNPES